VIAVCRVCYEAYTRARSSGGPTLIECHGGGDPLVHLQRHLEKMALWSEKWRQKVVRETTSEIKDAVRSAKKLKRDDQERAEKEIYRLSFCNSKGSIMQKRIDR
jgi:TPP-dependent pyruvate/acetoin dehydrogenase alpha subunit